MTMKPILRFHAVEETVQAELAKPYEYGVADCFALGCRVADALDPSLGLCDRYLGTYDSLRGAQKALRAAGYATLTDFYAASLQSCAPAEARFGDLAIVQVGKAQHVAVCLSTRFVSKDEDGLVYYTVSDCVVSFRTGD